MSSAQEKPLDLTPLADRYDIVGEYPSLGQNRRYPGRRREDGRDVLVTVLRAAQDVAQGKAIAQYAADANLLAGLDHPNVPRVIEGRWIGTDAFALVTDRVHGATLAELLKGERLTNPRIADILADVDGVLEWARGERLSHRTATPDGIWIERGTNRVFVTLSPTDAPKTNRPDPRDDARTIGGLAITMLTARPMADDHDGTLADMRPDLPQRVVASVEKVAACTINDDAPDISGFLASLAMADAIKEGEIEVARVEAEFRAQMKAEREKWEAEQQARELANEAQARKFADERAEYDRRAAKEREQLAEARAEIDKRRAELQEARTELDQARAVYKQKKAEIEARAKQVDKHMASLEKQKRALEKRAAQLEQHAVDLEQRNRELQELAALTALAATGAAAPVDGEMVADDARPADLAERIRQVGEIGQPPQPIAAIDDQDDKMADPPQDDVAIVKDAVEAEEEVQAWTPIEAAEPWAVPLETDEPVQAIRYEAAAVPEPEPKKRAAWMVPAGIAGAILVIAGAAYAVSRDQDREPPTRTIATAPRPATAGLPVRSDSAAGTIAAVNDSAVFNAIRDSIVAADEARRIRRAAAAAAAAAEAERQRQQPRTYTDSTGVVWTVGAPPPVRRDTLARPIVPRPDSVRPRPDTLVRPRPDTTSAPIGRP